MLLDQVFLVLPGSLQLIQEGSLHFMKIEFYQEAPPVYRSRRVSSSCMSVFKSTLRPFFLSVIAIALSLTLYGYVFFFYLHTADTFCFSPVFSIPSIIVKFAKE